MPWHMVPPHKKERQTHSTGPQECQPACDQLKRALLKAPVLTLADFSLPFRLSTDTSFEGLGVVLAQIKGDKEWVITYASRPPPSREHISLKLELMALECAFTEEFKNYLYGAEFSFQQSVDAPWNDPASQIQQWKEQQIPSLRYGIPHHLTWNNC